MAVNKKGFYFTTIAIALSVVVILSYNVYNNYRLKDKMVSVETRVNTINSFIKSLENEVGNAIFVVGFRSLLSLEDYMMEKDNFINNLGTNLNNAFKEVFQQGTINSEKMILMENNTFINWTNKMKEQANKTDIVVIFTINDVTISQSSPWKVDVSVNLKIEIKDTKNTASWTITKTFTNSINITGLVDPLYLVNNDGKVNNTIRKTIVKDFKNKDDLEAHMLNSYYIEHTDAPSYLMRFENNLGSSPYGIESLVNSQKLIDEKFPARDRSAVDFIYFGTGVTQNCNIEELKKYNWFKLDNGHLGFYESKCKKED